MLRAVMDMPVIAIFGIDIKELVESLSPYGEIALWLIVFAETGLLIGFFLPGDSLLFTAGVLAGQGDLDVALVVIGCFVAAVAGDQTGYTIGKRLGPRLFTRPNSRLFKHENVERTRVFFEKHGVKTIVIARFIPIVRTFAPTMAGVGGMPRRTFVIYNVIGALLWAVGVTMLGFALGDAIGEDIDTYLLPLVAVIVAISLIPPLIEWRRARKLRAEPVSEPVAEAEVEELEEILDPTATMTEPSNSVPFTCPKCNSMSSAGADFCSACGTELFTTSASDRAPDTQRGWVIGSPSGSAAVGALSALGVIVGTVVNWGDGGASNAFSIPLPPLLDASSSALDPKLGYIVCAFGVIGLVCGFVRGTELVRLGCGLLVVAATILYVARVADSIDVGQIDVTSVLGAGPWITGISGAILMISSWIDRILRDNRHA